MEAADRGHASVVEFLLDHGGDLEAKGQGCGGTVLGYAAATGDVPTVKAVLAHGPDIEARAGDPWRGATPVWIAAFMLEDGVGQGPVGSRGGCFRL